jgi:transcriptional regulator with XRE-family HTH domain
MSASASAFQNGEIMKSESNIPVTMRRVRLERIQRGLLQEQVAREVGTPVCTLHRIENDPSRIPRSPLFEKLEEFYGLPFEALSQQVEIARNSALGRRTQLLARRRAQRAA